MNKLVSTLLAGAAALALSGGAFAAEEAGRDSGKDAQNQTQGAPVDPAGHDVNTDGRDAGHDSTVTNEGRDSTVTNERDATVNNEGREATEGQTTGTVKEGGEEVTAEGRDPVKQEYEAELKKCDSMTDSHKTTCTDAAKKKHGQM